MKLTIEISDVERDWVVSNVPDQIMLADILGPASIIDGIAEKIYRAIRAVPMPCGHPIEAVVGTDEGTNYCRECVNTVESSQETAADQVIQGY